jgi:hypothetical protein
MGSTRCCVASLRPQIGHLGVSSIYEFGAARPDLAEINVLLARSLRQAIAAPASASPDAAAPTARL